MLKFLHDEEPVMRPLLSHTASSGVDERKRAPFEVLVRHLFDRLLRSESLGGGDENATRITQLLYAVALPGVVVAVFLFPLYHWGVEPRPMWPQIGDRLFYVTYSFVVMGLGTVLQWDLLFPDQLDAFILTSLPIPHRKLLLARVVALAIFLGAILIGANLLGIGAYPVGADVSGTGLNLPASHAIAVLSAGLCVSAFLIALQGLFICVLGQRMARRIAPIVQTLCVLLLLTTLFLSPLVSRYLEVLLYANHRAIYWFPPFWFVGLYERLLWGGSALPVFSKLARIGLRATAVVTLLALITYPLAYARRMRQIVEGTGTRSQRATWKPFDGLLHNTLLREPRLRAIYHLIGQTLFRTQRLRLLLAIFGGLGLAMTIAWALLIRVRSEAMGFELSPHGIRFAVPVLAFWTVAGLRAAFRATVAQNASWVFRVIHGRPKYDHLYAPEIWAGVCASLVTVTFAAVLHVLSPYGFQAGRTLLFQALIAIAVSILLTDIFFFNERAIPFTEAPTYSVSNLSFVVITYFLLFPAFTLGLVAVEPWIEASPLHLVVAILGAGATHIILRRVKSRRISEHAKTLDMDEAILMPGQMGLRNE
jgi:hypothetical protein